MEFRKMVMMTLYVRQQIYIYKYKEYVIFFISHRYKEYFWTLWEERVG